MTPFAFAWPLVLLTLAAPQSETPAAPAALYVVDEAAKIAFPIPGSPDEAPTFLLAARDGDATDVRLRPREIRDPAGRSRDLGLVKLTPEQLSRVPRDGVPVGVALDAAKLDLPGDYRVVLFAEGKGPGDRPAAALIRLTFTRPAAQINLDELKDDTVELTRWCPLGSARGTRVLPLRETTGRADLLRPAVQGQSLLGKDNRLLVAGSVTASLPKGVDRIAAGDQQELTVQFTGADTSGTFTTALVISSPSLDAPRVVPLRVVVTDYPVWPLLVIAVGVFGGFWMHYLAENRRPRLRNELTLARLSAEVTRLRSTARRADKLGRLDGIDGRLRSAADKNNFGQAAAAEELLRQAEQDLDAYRKDEVTAKAQAQETWARLRRQVEQLRQQAPGPAAPPADVLDDCAARLDAIDALLRADRVDDAAKDLADVEVRLAALQSRALEKYLTDLGTDLRELEAGQAHAAEVQHLQTLIGEGRAALAAGRIDEARAKAVQAEEAYRNLRAVVVPPAGRGQHRPRHAQLAAAAAPPPPEPAVEAADPPAARIAEVPLTFRILDPGGHFPNDATFSWHFGEEGTQWAPGGRESTHAYREPGTYRVKVEVRPAAGGPALGSLATEVVVLPGRLARQTADIGGRLWRVDAILSGVSLVLAALTGLLYLYVGKPFGSLSDYLLALFWGFGIDSSVRGFTAVLKRVTTSGT
jgi:hypothetical protein